MFLKFTKFLKKRPLLESLFDKRTDFQTLTLWQPDRIRKSYKSSHLGLHTCLTRNVVIFMVMVLWLN